MEPTIQKLSGLTPKMMEELHIVLPDEGAGVTFTVGKGEDAVALTVPRDLFPWKATRFLKQAYRDLRAMANDAHTYDDPDISVHFLWLVIEGVWKKEADRPVKNEDMLKNALTIDQLNNLHAICYGLMYEPGRWMPEASKDFFLRQAPVARMVNDPRLELMLSQIPVMLAKGAELGETITGLIKGYQHLEEEIEKLRSELPNSE